MQNETLLAMTGLARGYFDKNPQMNRLDETSLIKWLSDRAEEFDLLHESTDWDYINHERELIEFLIPRLAKWIVYMQEREGEDPDLTPESLYLSMEKTIRCQQGMPGTLKQVADDFYLFCQKTGISHDGLLGGIVLKCLYYGSGAYKKDRTDHHYLDEMNVVIMELCRQKKNRNEEPLIYEYHIKS